MPNPRIRPRPRRSTGRLAAAAAAVVLLIYALNLPFYSGGSLGRWNQWRMEHGRLKWTHGFERMPESLWIAANSEGLKFAPRWRRIGPGAWELLIPLWLPLAACAAAATWGLWPHRPRPQDACPRCGYDLSGISADRRVCPECGPRPAQSVRG